MRWENNNSLVASESSTMRFISRQCALKIHRHFLAAVEVPVAGADFASHVW